MISYRQADFQEFLKKKRRYVEEDATIWVGIWNTDSDEGVGEFQLGPLSIIGVEENLANKIWADLEHEFSVSENGESLPRNFMHKGPAETYLFSAVKRVLRDNGIMVTQHDETEEKVNDENYTYFFELGEG